MTHGKYIQEELPILEDSTVLDNSGAEKFNDQILETSSRIESIMKEKGIPSSQGEYPGADEIRVYTFKCGCTHKCNGEIEVCLALRHRIGKYLTGQHPDDEVLPVQTAIRFKKTWTDNTTGVKKKSVRLADGIHKTVSRYTGKTSDKIPPPDPIPLTKASQFSGLSEEIFSDVKSAFNHPRDNSPTTTPPEHSHPAAVNTRPAN